MFTAQMFGPARTTWLPIRSEPSIADRRSLALHMATRTRFPRAASASASAAHTVVFPTPPLPVTMRNRLSSSAAMLLFLGWTRSRCRARRTGLLHIGDGARFVMGT
jgi:hypothetical protein